MTNEQKTIERNEFGCEDGASALAEVIEKMAEKSWGDTSGEAVAMRTSLVRAAIKLNEAASALSVAYEAVGEYEKACRRNKGVK